MKLKEIWTLIKTVIWPAAKPFICASREEAAELVEFYRTISRAQLRSDMNLREEEIKPVPEFVLRCIEALDPDEN